MQNNSKTQIAKAEIPEINNKESDLMSFINKINTSPKFS